MPNAPLNLSDIWRVLGRKLDVTSRVALPSVATVKAQTALYQSPSAALYRIEAIIRTVTSQVGADVITLTVSWTNTAGGAVSLTATCDLTILADSNAISQPIDMKQGSSLSWKTTQSGAIGAGRYQVFLVVYKLT